MIILSQFFFFFFLNLAPWMLGIREIVVFFLMFLVALMSAHQLLVNFGFSFKTVVKNKEECVGKCFSNKENKKNVF